MRIGTVKIQNYRSIRFAEISPTSFNLFVGQNNHGKTNFFEALEWFFTGPRKAEEADQLKNVAARQDEMYVEIEFVDFHSAIAQMKNEKNKKVLEGLIKDHPKIVLRRSSQDPKKRVFVKNGVPEEKNPTGFDPALNDFLPKFEFIETKVKLQDIAAYKSTSPIGSMLTSVLTALLETNQEYKDFRNTFNNLFKSESSEIKVKLVSLSPKIRPEIEIEKIA